MNKNTLKVEENIKRVIVEESKTDDLYLMIEKYFKTNNSKLDLSKEYFDLLKCLRRLEKIADDLFQ